jgi:hypothetical protein
VVEMGVTEMSGFTTDLGLLPGGRVKLIKSSEIVMDNLTRFKKFWLMGLESSSIENFDFYKEQYRAR